MGAGWAPPGAAPSGHAGPIERARLGEAQLVAPAVLLGGRQHVGDPVAPHRLVGERVEAAGQVGLADLGRKVDEPLQLEPPGAADRTGGLFHTATRVWK